MKNKTVVLGITGGIAVYKACDLVSRLKKAGAIVHVAMTKSATEFVSPLTFESLSQNRVTVDMFDRNFNYDIEHISLAKKADVLVIVPATANIIAKLNLGIADDMLTTTALAMTCPKIICPAMNTNMYNNPAYRANQAGLLDKGFIFVAPASGRLACGDMGEGKLASVEDIYNSIKSTLNPVDDYTGKNILLTVGATRENIDGVRYITNHSSGKMGGAIAHAAVKRGANVTIICANVTAEMPASAKIIKVDTTSQMFDAVMQQMLDNDIIIKAAAPADYSVENTSQNKIKDENVTLKLKKNVDIASEVGKLKKHRILVAFCAETENLLANARKKLASKNADIIIANDVTTPGAGFNTDTNIVTILDNKGNAKDYPIMQKSKLADIILDYIIKL